MSATGRAPAEWLGLAATPAFALMTAMTVVPSGEAVSIVCGAAMRGSLLDGMAPMYAAMSVFHASPWLRLISNMRGRVQRVT